MMIHTVSLVPRGRGLTVRPPPLWTRPPLEPPSGRDRRRSRRARRSRRGVGVHCATSAFRVPATPIARYEPVANRSVKATVTFPGVEGSALARDRSRDRKKKETPWNHAHHALRVTAR